MEGKVLGFDSNVNEGAINGKEGTRYAFSKNEWRGSVEPVMDMLVDFEVEGDKAVRIYPIKNHDAEENRLIIGIISLAITFFLGFIGTLISRMAISKHTFSKAALPTFIHLLITLIGLIPVVGWIFYVIGTVYFMVKNYKLIPGISYSN